MARTYPKKSNKAARFAQVPRKVLADPDFIQLTHATRLVLVLLAGQFGGFNNGALGLSKSQAEALGVSNKTLYRALDELEAIDVIRQTRAASRVPPRPTMYALTWLAVDDTEHSRKTRTPARLFRRSKWP